MPSPIEIIAHRGAPRDRPENTIPSFRRAVELRADAVELDVHATRDGVVVVHHDPVPRARAGVAELAGRPIAELTWAELQTFRVADDVGVPTLEMVLGELAGRVGVYVEVKAPGAESRVADLLAGYGGSHAVHAFDHRVTRRVRSRSPALRGGILLVSYLVDTPAAMRAADALDVWQHWELVDDALVRDVHAAGGRVIAWTVNEPAVARSLAGMGVDGICSDVPGEVRAVLASLAPPRTAP